MCVCLYSANAGAFVSKTWCKRVNARLHNCVFSSVCLLVPFGSSVDVRESDVSATITFAVAGDREAIPRGRQGDVRLSLHAQVGGSLHSHHPLHHITAHTRVLVKDARTASGCAVRRLNAAM